MEIYKPNGKINAVLPLEGDIFFGGYTFNRLSSDREITRHVESCSKRMQVYYEARNFEIPPNFFIRFGHVAIETLIDTVKHGVFPVSHRLFIAQKGVCQGVQDSGDFYKREDVKQKVESRILLEEITPETMGLDHGRGLAYVYAMSNAIEVDTTNGILWAAHLR
ncbi:MAG: hypothetical protein WC979_08565 [Candidatus Pacearchaeota archaeon]|jgi:hypothetical protein